MKTNVESQSFRKPKLSRVLLLVVIALFTSVVIWFFKSSFDRNSIPGDAVWAISLISIFLFFGIGFRLLENLALVTVNSDGLSLNWLPMPLPWSEVLGGRIIVAQGFSLGMGWVELYLKTPMEMHLGADFETYVPDGFVDSVITGWKQTVHAAPVWTLETPTTLRIATAHLNTSPNHLAESINVFLREPLLQD
jgi:hypothetical protein